MSKHRITLSLIVAATFGAGYLVIHSGAVTPTLAASTHSHKTATTAHTATRASNQTATPHADGKVTGVNSNTITVQADSDAAGSTEFTKVTTIVLTDSTKYAAGVGATTTTKPAISTGEFIVAEGTISADGTTLTATLVSVGTGGRGHGGSGHASGPHADGTVTNVNGNTITVKADNDPSGSTEYTGVTTILLTGTTQYDAGHGATTTTRPTISAGQFIIAEGTVSADGTTLTATRVSVRASAAAAHSR